MDTKRFENFEAENPFFEEHFVFKQKPADKRPVVASLDSIMNPSGRKREAGADQRELSEKELAALRAKKEAEKRKRLEASKKEQDKLRSKVGPRPKKETPQKTRKGLRNTRERVEKDLDLGRDGLEKYMKGLREALKEIPPNKLRNFIRVHDKYGGGDHKQWNEDLRITFNLQLHEGQPVKLEERRYAAALQILLGDHFVNKGDIFQANRKKIGTNPFVYIDGYLGGFTMSVLAAYWNSKYSKKRKETLDYANLKPEYGALRKNQAVYDEAIKHLKERLGGKVETSDTQKLSTVPSAPQTASERLSDTYSKYANAYVNVYNKTVATKPSKFTAKIFVVDPKSFMFEYQFNNCIGVVEKKKLTKNSPLEDWIKAFKEAKADLNVLVPGYIFERKAPKPPKAPERTKITPKQQKLIDAFTVGAIGYGEKYWNKYDSQYQDYKSSLEDLAASGYKPEILTDLDDYSDSWVGKAYAKYVSLYKSIEGGAAAKAYDPKIKEAYTSLWQVVKDYHAARWNAYQELNKIYKAKVRLRLGNIELPEEISAKQYKGSVEFWNAEFNVYQECFKKINRRELKSSPKERQTQLERHFAKSIAPTRTFKDWASLEKSIKKGYKESVIQYFGNGDKQEALKQVNLVIKMQNMRRLTGTKGVRRETERDYKRDLGLTTKIVDENFNVYSTKGLKAAGNQIAAKIKQRVSSF